MEPAVPVPLGFGSWARACAAVEEGKQRLYRATATLEQAGLPYAVIGGHAVSFWIARVDAAAVRNTADVDILLSRSDLPMAQLALGAAGFCHHEMEDGARFLDSPKGSTRVAVHILFAGEKVREESLEPTPGVSESEKGDRFWVVSLEPLVRAALTSFRLKDQVHLQDMIGVGLLDMSWPARFPPELGARLQRVLDNPNG